MKVNKKILIVAVIFLSLCSGCVVTSFYPLYTDDVLVRNDNIIGKWETAELPEILEKDNDTLVWEILKKEEVTKIGGKQNQKLYNETYKLYSYYLSDPEVKTELQLHLVELEGKAYFDFFLENYEVVDDFIAAMHLMVVHTFAKADVCTDSIVVNWYDSDWLSKKLEANKIRIKHEKDGDNILLTAQPKELQKFVSKYSNNKNATDNIQLILKPRK